MKSWVGSGRTHVRRRRVGKAPQERPDWKLFSRIRRSMEQLSLRTSVLARCWLTMWNVHRNGSCRHRLLKCLMPCLRSMPSGPGRVPGDSVGWRETDFDGWNQDQTLRSSMRHSTVWVYQQFAREIGEVREKEYLTRIQYGNADRPSGGVDRFWLDGAPDFSHGTGDFCENLYRNELVQVEHQRLVKDIMIVEAGRDWILRAKTGWQARV